MVSRVYTPMVAPYARPHPVQGQPSTLESVQTDASRQEAAIHAETGDLQRPSAGLKAVQTDQFRKIPLDAVLHDFKSTIDALGADEQTRREVTAYLQIVSLQGSKENPEIPFVKHTLRTAANTLDQFITGALGQPSHVVKEWVDALLLQDIDYRVQEQPEWLASVTAGDAGSEPVANVAKQPSADELKKQVKSLVEQAKTQFKERNIEKAEGLLEEALTVLEAQEQPLLSGKVWQLRARFQDKTGNWQQAVSFYEQAASHFEMAGKPEAQADALHRVASILDGQGRLDEALPFYRAVTELDRQYGTPHDLATSLNDLGKLYLRQGKAAEAISTLESAVRESLKVQDDKALQSDLLNNWGAACRAGQNYETAILAFRRSLSLADSVGDRVRYIGTLRQLAATYVESNQPQLAMKALQRLAQLQEA